MWVVWCLWQESAGSLVFPIRQDMGYDIKQAYSILWNFLIFPSSYGTDLIQTGALSSTPIWEGICICVPWL
jgi:hypothetical protein